MKRTKRILAITLAVLFLLPVLAACSKNDTPNTAGNDPIASLPTTAPAAPTGHTLDEIAQATGTIITNTGAFGSGVIIGDGLVAACFDLLAETPLDSTITAADFILDYGTETETSYPITRVVSYSWTDNIAILKIDAAVSPVPLGSADTLAVGDALSVIGAPIGEKATANAATEAQISGRAANAYGIMEMALSAGAERLSGGSAVVRAVGDVDHYELVGLLASHGDSATLLPLALPADIATRAGKTDGLSLEEMNASRKYFRETARDENNNERISLAGAWYDKTNTEVLTAPLWDHSSPNHEYLYDKFTVNQETRSRTIKDLYIWQSNSGTYHIRDVAASPSYKLGYVGGDSPYYHFSQSNAAGYLLDYCAWYHPNVNSVYLSHRVNVDGKDSTNDEGARILLSNLGERIYLQNMEDGLAQGFVVQVSGDNLFFYAYKDGKNTSKNIRFNMRTAEFHLVDYVNDERQGDWILTKPSDLPQFTYEALSADSGRITYAAENLSVEWSGGGTSYVMDSPTQYAAKKDGEITAYLKSNNAFNPYVSVRLHGDYLSFSASKSAYAGTIRKDGSWAALYNADTGRLAEINGTTWYVGEGTIAENEESADINGTGVQYDRETAEMYAGTFAAGVPSGHGARVTASQILEGEWDGDKLLSSVWE